MIPRIDATLENLHAVLERHGYADVITRYYGPVTPYVADGWARVRLTVVADESTPQHGDPWAVRRWGHRKVRACLADLQAHGWYLHGHLEISQRSHVESATWTVAGDCFVEPSEHGMSCDASFEVIGFPPATRPTSRRRR